MKLYIFNSVDDKYALPFRLFVINQNLKVARISSAFIIGISSLVLISGLFFDFTSIEQLSLFRYGFLGLLLISLGFYFAIGYARKATIRRRLLLKKVISNSYPLIIIFGMMWMSLVSGRTPANNMTMFMFGLLFVAVSWLFNLSSAILASVVTYIVLGAGLYMFNDGSHAAVTDLIAGGIIIIGFYFISRMLYSYHANYFIQLKQIEHNNYEITKMAQLKTEMLGIVAHDLRSPLNSITALVELSKNVKVSDGEREQYSDMILESCEEARNIIRDLILIVKGESSTALQLTDINLNIFLSQMQQHWALQLKDDKQLLLHLPEHIIMAKLDKDKMLRVFDNLIGNAVKFTEDGARIQLDLWMKEKDLVMITVSDDGIGIPKSIQPFLFERFSKAGRLGLKGEKSHGLGLNICKQIVEQHGGKIELESEEGKGTKFHISIPVHHSVEKEIGYLPTKEFAEIEK